MPAFDYDDRLHFDVTLIKAPAHATTCRHAQQATAASREDANEDGDVRVQSFERSARERELLRSFTSGNGGARRLQEFHDMPRPHTHDGAEGDSLASGLAKLDAIQRRLDMLQTDYVARQEALLRQQEAARVEHTASAMERLRDLHERQMEWQEGQLAALESLVARSAKQSLYSSPTAPKGSAFASPRAKKKKSNASAKKTGTSAQAPARSDAATSFTPNASYRGAASGRLSVTGHAIQAPSREDDAPDREPLPPGRADVATETDVAAAPVAPEEGKDARHGADEHATPLDRYLGALRREATGESADADTGERAYSYERVADVMTAARRVREQLERDSGVITSGLSGAGSAGRAAAGSVGPSATGRSGAGTRGTGHGSGGAVGGRGGASGASAAGGHASAVGAAPPAGTEAYDVLMQRVLGGGRDDPLWDQSRIRHEVGRRIHAAIDDPSAPGAGAGAAGSGAADAWGSAGGVPYGAGGRAGAFGHAGAPERPTSPSEGGRTGPLWAPDRYDGIYLTHLYGRPFHYPKRVTIKPPSMRYVSEPLAAPGVIRRPTTVESSSLLPPRVLKVESQPLPKRPDLKVVHVVADDRKPLVAEMNVSVDIPPATPAQPSFIAEGSAPVSPPPAAGPRSPSPLLPPAPKEPSDVPVDWVRSEVLAGLLGEIGSRLPPRPQPAPRAPSPPRVPTPAPEGIDPSEIAAMVRDSLASLLAQRARERPKTPPKPRSPSPPPRVSPPKQPSPPRVPSPPPRARHASPPPPPSKPDRHEAPVRDARRDDPPPADVAADLPARDFASAMPRPAIDARGGDAFSPGASPIRRPPMVERAASPRTPTASAPPPESPATPASVDTSSIPTTSVFTDNFISEGELLGDGYSDGEFYPRAPRGRRRADSDTDEELPGYDLSEMEVPLPHRIGHPGVLSPGEPVDFGRPVHLPYVPPPQGPRDSSEASESAGELRSASPSASDATLSPASHGERVQGHTRIIRPSPLAVARARAPAPLESDEDEGRE